VTDVRETAAASSELKKKRVRSTDTNILRGWYIGTHAEIANTKHDHMVGFKDLTAEFVPEFDSLEDLAEELTEHSFPQSKPGHRNIQRLPHYIRQHDSWVQQSNKPASRGTNARIDKLKTYVGTKLLLAIC
jgi:hypothetical protein